MKIFLLKVTLKQDNYDSAKSSNLVIWSANAHIYVILISILMESFRRNLLLALSS